MIVARTLTRKIPDSHIGLPVQQQKDSFVSIVLPLILAANEEIGQRRSAIMRAADAQDMDSLQRWAKLYRVNTDGRSIEEIRTNILDRADFIPVSLALAQAAIESGWGTSRFARQGNALFGQWAWQASQGIKPAQASNEPSAPVKPEAKLRPAKAPAAPPAASPKVSKAAPVPVIVARTLTRKIPDSHIGLPVQQQKDSFVSIVLPLILAANEEIGQRRSAIMRAADAQDMDSLQRWAKLYRVNTDGRSIEEIRTNILDRADFIPVSLALAQAAIESGWGTSRFARQGNALFGQWAWQASQGIKPAQASNSRAVVRSFPNLFGSVRAYMHNLNTHASYASFRERRKIMRGRLRADLGFQLASHLDGYAEIGTAYVDKLRTLIRTNDFGRFEAAKLRWPATSPVYSGRN